MFILHKGIYTIFPKSGWVEHNANEIWSSILSVIATVFIGKKYSILNKLQESALQINEKRLLFGIKIQGMPIYNAIVWQSRQTAEICEQLKEKGYNELFRR